MAFDEAAFFTTLGKYVKAVNAMEVLITTYGNTKTDLATVMNSEGYLDYYDTIPSLVHGIQDGVTSWINTEITDSKSIFTDKTNLISELDFTKYTTEEALQLIHEYMIINVKSVLNSSVTYNAAATDNKVFMHQNIVGPSNKTASVFVGGILSGSQSPGTGIPPYKNYNGVTSQLVIPATINLEVIDDTTIGSEVIRLNAPTRIENPYKKDVESPGVGPNIVNIHGKSITSNDDFSSWTNDNPDNWTMAGGVSGTDWVKVTGPPDYLLVNTNGVSLTQTITGLSTERLYFVGVYWEPVATSGSVDLDVLIDAIPAIPFGGLASFTSTKLFNTTDFYAYKFFTLPATHILPTTLTLTPTLGAGETAIIRKAIIAPATYYNGAGWVSWSGATYDTGTAASDSDKFVKGDIGEMIMANDNAGVFQTFMRKAFKHQLPTNSTPSIADSLAT